MSNIDEQDQNNLENINNIEPEPHALNTSILRKKRKRPPLQQRRTNTRFKKLEEYILIDEDEIDEPDSDKPDTVDMVDDPRNLLKKTSEAFKTTFGRKSNTEFIKRALEQLKSDDDMIVLNCLCELSSELSMANDNVAEDSSCQTLIKELIVLFDKFMLPDIGMSALNCVNYLLDINPRYTSSIIKWNGVGKIVNMTQNIEYIDCAEMAIKAIEKMSFENPYAMIEKDAFSAVLSLIDFFDMNLRKSALKACLNMTRAINNMDYIRKFIIPAVPSLTNLTKFSGNTDLEKSILDLAVSCFYNIVFCIKNYNLQTQGHDFYTNMIIYGLLENLFEVFEKFINFEENVKSSNLSIYHETFKNILKLFEVFCSLSPEITNVILNMNILEIIYSVLVKELGQGNAAKSRLSSNSHSVYNELFALLTSFFPNKKSSEPDRLMTPCNKHFLIYFSEKILNLLIDNTVNIPSSNTMVQIMKLLEMYITYSPNDLIMTYIDPNKFSNIAGKMLDSRDSSYILEVFAIVEVIMNKVPEFFFVSFIREGVVDNIRNLQQVEETALYIPPESTLNKNLLFKYKYVTEQDDIEDEFADEMEFKDENDKLKDYVAKKQELLDMFSKKFELKKNEKVDENVESEGEVENMELEAAEIKPENENKIVKPKLAKKLSYSQSVVKNIKNKAKELFDKYFLDEYIQSLLDRTHILSNPREILNKLINIKDTLHNPESVNLNDLVYFADMLFSKDKITFYEIEKSQIIHNLAKFFDENFSQNYENTMETDHKTKTIITRNYNKKIINNLKMFFSALNNDVEKISEFIKILQYCISSMNCFKLFLYDAGGRSSSQIIFSALRSEIQKLRIKFLYSPSEISMKKLNENENNAYKEIYDYFLNKKYVSLSIDQSETFEQVKENIFKSRIGRASIASPTKDECYEEIITQLRNRKNSEEDINLTEKLLHKLIERKKSAEYSSPEEATHIVDNELDINFYALINNARLDIQKDWTILEFIKEVKAFAKKSDFLSFYSDIQINFDIVFKADNIQTAESKHEKESKSDAFEGNYEEYLFEYFYKSNLNNKALYCIKRASPFIFLISLMELAVNNFKNLFNLKESIDIANLENLKVTSLLFKQVKDPYAISSSSIPVWCKDLCQNFTYLSGFNSRYLLFKTSSFDVKRSMNNLYVYLKNFMGENIVDDKTLSNAKRHKFKIDRNNLIRDTDALMKEFSNFSGYLEFEYLDETGTGLGPTLEFYSLFAKEVKNMPHLWYKTHDYSLFPTPCLDNVEENVKFFTLLGFVIARGLYDDRLLDFPLNSLFWDLVFDRPISIEKINKIDKDLGKAMIQFTNNLNEKKKFQADPKYAGRDINDLVRYNGCKIEDIGLTFTLPGYNDIELKRGGSDIIVNAENLDEYVYLVFNRMLLTGPLPYIEAFKLGFNKVFPINTLKCFTSTELEEIICGSSSESWDYATLLANTTPNHGYDKNSIMYQGLLKLMTEMNSLERKMFLLFVTGSPRLPLGGFKNLSPKMTVVKKQPVDPNENLDDYLPTVMTCQNYLKIPVYSSINVLKEKLYLAMNEGSNAFHLS